MSYHTGDTIAAIASAPGGAACGVVRISGPRAIDCLATCFKPADQGVAWTQVKRPSRIRGVLHVVAASNHPPLAIPGALLIWPNSRSYTRELSVEFHTLGSPPLLAAVLEALADAGVRAAAPGEYTLRAFLAGRIDLTQAEAVLGVIDARGRAELDAALDQLAGGLSRPLHEAREQLLGLLAELEAGLDFVEEDIEFISRDALLERLDEAQQVVQFTLAQLATRDQRGDLPRVALVGPPNSGKSSLFNALVRKYRLGAGATAIVSPVPGATRDYVVAQLVIGDFRCELIDTAGEDASTLCAVQAAAQEMTARQRQTVDLRLHCIVDASSSCARDAAPPDGDVIVLTKADLALNALEGACCQSIDRPIVRCSALTGLGLDELAAVIRHRLTRQAGEPAHGTAGTAARCRGSLQSAEVALTAAARLVGLHADELIAAEVRSALEALGEVVGAICADDVLDRIFRQFCIGK